MCAVKKRRPAHCMPTGTSHASYSTAEKYKSSELLACVRRTREAGKVRRSGAEPRTRPPQQKQIQERPLPIGGQNSAAAAEDNKSNLSRERGAEEPRTGAKGTDEVGSRGVAPPLPCRPRPARDPIHLSGRRGQNNKRGCGGGGASGWRKRTRY
jgi:hypothetical protein